MFSKLIILLTKLEENKIFFSLERIREETIMVSIVVPGQRWEVEFFANGSVEIEKFHSDGTIYDIKELDSLFENFSE